MAHVTRYARNGDVNIAFRAHGDGPVDLLFVSAFINHVEHIWVSVLGGGASRAVRCARAADRVTLHGIDLRIGLHTGACE